MVPDMVAPLTTTKLPARAAPYSSTIYNMVLFIALTCCVVGAGTCSAPLCAAACRQGGEAKRDTSVLGGGLVRSGGGRW